MKSFRERNPLTLGVAGSVVLAAVLTLTLNWENLPVVGGGTTYQAEFTEAAGLQADDEVRVAGIKVGEVDDVELADDHVLVSFRVKDAWIGDRTSAQIKIKTLLGRKFLALNPTGGADQDPDRPIPRTRTVTPFDVTDAFNGLADTAGAIDTKQLADSFTAISDTFRNSPEHVRTALDGLSALSKTVSSRDNEIAELLSGARKLTTTLANSNDDFEKLIDDGNLLLTELDHRREAIHQLLVGAQQLAQQLNGLVADNKDQLAPALGQLGQVTDLLQRQNDNLAKSLQLAGPYFRVVNNAVGNGRWVDSYLCGLIPENRDPCTPPKGGAK
ncbi:MCE family protein [Amycolatopsis sp. PS_44_ISF1]|uniref:MCE family protein n=1 Tax=Amycolatopsis sp. PS_44_ISF1 TaxID=2974917 RepID=UPI0028DD9268|nr:MCE family protein [Amycolatopsis sp. PS_44_ISF1]MDT8915604.1 MCE family protein [Amycolatopsis sp. PS_44_ISF1]